MRVRIALAVVLFAGVSTALILACTDDSTTPLPPAPVPPTDAAIDHSVADTSAPDTSAPDANVPDANAPDTSVPELNGCGPAEFADADYSDPDASRVIDFPDSSVPTAPDGALIPLAYSPSCMTIKAGESITWVGNFDVHVLGADDNKPNNPIPLSFRDAAADGSLSITFYEAGTFGYECQQHAIMRGAVNVKP